MKMDGQIRIKTDSHYSTLYNELKNFVVGDFHELFFICACFGYINKSRKPLGKTKDDKFWSSTITPKEWACYYTMILEENKMNFHSIQDDKMVISKIEEYANAGMDILIKDFLEIFLVQNAGEYKLASGIKDDLPKDFLHFIFESINTET